MEGAQKGSKTLLFSPGQAEGYTATELSPAFKKVTRGKGEVVYETRLDIGTAGATGLALQAILPFILFTRFPSAHPVRLTLTGGTNVSGSPSYEYISQVLLPTLHAIGLPEVKGRVVRRGWSQGGGSSIGEVILHIPYRISAQLGGFTLRPPPPQRKLKPTHLQATFIAPSTCHAHFRQVLAPALAHHFGPDFSIEGHKFTMTCEDSGHDKRMYFILVATLPSPSSSSPPHKVANDWLYERKIRSNERAATEMAERVTNDLRIELESGAYVDDHMRDQLAIFQALAAGTSEVYPGVNEDGELREPSLHARTAEWVAKRLLGVTFDAESACEGVGFRTGAGEKSLDGTEAEDHEQEAEETPIEHDLQKLDLS